MAKKPKRIEFDDFTLNPEKVFNDMARQEEPILITVKGRVFRIELEPTRDGIWKGYNPQKVRQRLRETAGAMTGVDRKALLQDIHQAREQAGHRRSD